MQKFALAFNVPPAFAWRSIEDRGGEGDSFGPEADQMSFFKLLNNPFSLIALVFPSVVATREWSKHLTQFFPTTITLRFNESVQTLGQ
jgi:hypothetical protein